MSILTGVRDAVLSYYCVTTDVIGNAYHLFRPVLFGGLNLPTGLVDPVIDWLTVARNSICNDTPDYRGQASPGFTGGQCPVIYRPAYTIEQYDSLGNLTRSDTDPGATRIWGEITKGIDLYFAAGAGSQIIVDYYGHGSGNFPRLESEGISYSATAPYNPNTRSFKLVNLHYIRDDGNPDTCGDPPPVVPPPVNNYNTHNVNITYNDNGGNTVSIPVTLVYGQAFIDANLNVQIPVKVQFSPKVSFTANLNVQTGDVKIDLAPNISVDGGEYTINSNNDNRTTNTTNNYTVRNPPPPPPPGSNSPDVPDPFPPPGGDTGGGSSDPSSADRTQVIRGVIVTVTERSGLKEGVIYQSGGNPDIYIPTLGYVQFAISVKGSVSWTADKPVKSERAFIPCEWEGGAISVKGTPNEGVTWELTPVYSVTGA